MSVLLPLKNCKQMFWGHVKKLQSVDKLLIHWWFLLDNQHQKSAGKNSNIHSILTTYNTHGYTMRHGEVKMVTVQRCGQQYIHMHWRQCTKSCLGGGGGGGGVGCWKPSEMFYTNAHSGKNGGIVYNARNCGISIVMKIFLLYFQHWK